MRRLWPLFLIAVVVLVSVAWLTFRDGGDDGAPDRPRDEPGRSTPELPGSSAAGPEGPPVSVHLANGRYVLEGRVYRDDVPTKAVVALRLLHAGESRPGSIAGAHLDAPAEPGPALAKLSTRADGRFHFPGLAPGLYELRAEAEDGARAFGERWCALGGNRPPVRLDLEGALESLFGRALYSDGTPFPGVVWARDARLGTAMTESDGRFRLAGLPAGPCDLNLLDPGRLLVIRKVVLPHEGEITVIVDEGFRSARGTILAAHDESPVAGALVALRSSQSRTGATAVSGADGGFAARLPDETAFVTVDAEGFAPLRTAWPKGAEARFLLQRVGGVEGRVIEADSGEPVPGVPVFAGRVQRYGERVRATTGKEGRFRFESLAPGEVDVYAHGGGWVSEMMSSRTSFEVNPLVREVTSGVSSDVEIRVVRTGRAEGQVLDSTGEPLMGVAVAAETSSGWRGFRHTESSVSDSDGRFVFESLIPGFPYQLTAIPPGSPPISSGPHSARSGETVTVELVVAPPRWIDIEVVENGTGRPVVTAGVAIRQDGAALHFVTDGDGRVKVGPIAAGEAWVRVDHGHYLCTTTPYVVPAEGPDRLTVRLDRGLFLGGRLVVEGEEVSACSVSISSTPGINIFEVYGTRSRHTPESDGSFRIGPLPPGEYKLSVHDTWYRERSRSTFAAGREDIFLRIPAAPPPATAEGEKEQTDHGELVVHIRTADGRPPSTADVSIRTELDRAYQVMQTIEQSPSRVRYRILISGKRGWIQVSGARSAEGEPLGAAVHGPFDVRAGEITVRLPAGRSVRGSVLGPDGKGISGLAVYANVLDERSRFNGYRHGAARTSEGGRYRIGGLGEGRYQVTVNAPKEYLSPEPVAAESGSEGVEFHLRRAGSLTVRVEDEEGRPVSRVAVHAAHLPGLDRPANGWTQDSGTAELTRLQPGGVYRVRVVNVAGGKAGRVDEARVGEKPVKIRLAPGAAITGSFEVPEGASQFEVYASVDGIMVHGKVVGPGGRFEIRGLTDERWKVSAFAAGAGKSWAGETEAMAGEDVTIALRAR